jgi:hypothetical protein
MPQIWMKLWSTIAWNFSIMLNLQHPHQRWVCNSAKILLTSKFSYLLFCNTNHKTETQGVQIGWIQLLIANHLDQSLWLANEKPRSSSQITFITLFSSRCFAALSTSLSKLSKYAGEKPISWAKPACVDFSSSDFNVEGHLLSTLRSIALDVSKWCEALESYRDYPVQQLFLFIFVHPKPTKLEQQLQVLIITLGISLSFPNCQVLKKKKKVMSVWYHIEQIFCGPSGSFVSLDKFQTYLEL